MKQNVKENHIKGSKSATKLTPDDPIKAPMSKKSKEKIDMTKKLTEEEDSSPCKIKKKPIIRKRKKITFTMKQLENEAEEDSDEDFVA